jgi:hypothetical protein
MISDWGFPIQNPKSKIQNCHTLPDGKQIKGIYKLDGDTLTSCVLFFARGIPIQNPKSKIACCPGKDRPIEFASKPGRTGRLRKHQSHRPAELFLPSPLEGEGPGVRG